MSLPDSSSALDRARSKAFFHLLPLLFFCYVIAYVDRVNVSFAKLNMQEDLAQLGFSESAFGFGMGIFFIGYLLLEIPGTLLVEKWSARKWISWIMISWGIIAAMTGFVHYRVPGASAVAECIARAVASSLGSDLRRLKLRPYTRAPMARFAADHLRGNCAGIDTREPRRTLADNRFIHPGHDWVEGLFAGLLDLAQRAHVGVGSSS